MNTIETALAKSLKTGDTIRIRTSESAVAVTIALENAGCEITHRSRIDDPRKGSSLSALEIAGKKDGKWFEIIAAGARF